MAKLTGNDLEAEFFRICLDNAICGRNLNMAVDIGKIVQDYGIVGKPLGRLIYNVYHYLTTREMPDEIKN